MCKRLKKEVAAYEKEVITNEARVQKMKDEGRDVYGEVFMFILFLEFLTTLTRYSQARGSITRELYDGS